jgi:hypothetical protein
MSADNGSFKAVNWGSYLESVIEHMFDRGEIVVAVKIKYPGIDPLLIVNARTTEGPKVMFVKGKTIAEAVKTLHQKALADALEWRPDEWELQRLAENGK